jgi:hypothetical protein
VPAGTVAAAEEVVAMKEDGGGRCGAARVRSGNEL